MAAAASMRYGEDGVASAMQGRSCPLGGRMSEGSSSNLQPGDILAGKYQVEHVLGAGGMGVVVAARHVHLDTKVAVKFLRPEMLKNQDAIARFSAEARAAVQITSEHVARVFDVGSLETGVPYIVMEFLEGGDLAAWLQQRGALSVEQAVEFILQACVAIAEAHALGIVHRDLKPANLFCIRRPDGQLSIKVLDFGISKMRARGASVPPDVSVTHPSSLMGSPSYMSPEQMQSARNADAQSDIWALGVILYELLAGRVPFEGESVPDVAVKVATQAPPSLRLFRPDISPKLEAVVLHCLEKERERRYRNVAEVALALAEFAPKRARALIERITDTIHAAGLSVSALTTPPSLGATDTLVSPGSVLPISQTAAGTARYSVPRAALTGVATAGLIVLGGVMLVHNARPRTSAATEAAGPTPAPLATPLPAPAASTTGPMTTEPSPLAKLDASASSMANTDLPPATGSNAATAPVVQTRPRGAPKPTIKSAVPNCDPPYTLDDRGRKHFKHECYAN